MGVRKLALGIICIAAFACPWGKCGFAQDSSTPGASNSGDSFFDHTTLGAAAAAREQAQPAPEPDRSPIHEVKPAAAPESAQESAAEGLVGSDAPPDKKAGPVIPTVLGDFRRLTLTKSKARVTDIIDGVTITVDGKTKVRLTGIWVPWESADDPGETVRRAAALLKKVAMGRYVRLYQTKSEDTGRTNRLGQALAQVERDDGQWLQGILLYAGFATVMTSESNPEVAARMYEIEADARRRGAGLWGDERWNIVKPDKATDYVNEYRIVQGRVFSTAMRDNIFYINFSRDWRTDFTLAIPAERRLAFSRKGINLMGLNGKTIRVRGFIRNKNGPMIEITHPEQIELVDTP